MSEPKLISPMLDNFMMGDPISDRNGVRCCPAMENETDHKYIVKIISTPATQTQLDALLLTGVYKSAEEAGVYFKTLAEDIIEETLVLERLSRLEGFLPYAGTQLVPMDDATGYDVYLLSPYRKTLAQHLRHSAMTQLSALNLALDLCAALAVSRRSGYLYVNLKPENIYFVNESSCKIGDIGFLSMNSLRYVSLPDRYRSSYTAPEIADALATVNTTVDVYALGLILYQIYNDGVLPVSAEETGEAFAPPAYADYEMAEIILKACNPDPDSRWNDPVEMGQAIVSYMQRNGVHDTPIVPVAPAVDSEIENHVEEAETEAEEQIANSDDTTKADSEAEADEGYINLSFLGDEFDETSPEEVESEIEYTEVSEELTNILEQADDLISHPTPDPVVQPEPIEVQIPEPIIDIQEPMTEENAEDSVEDSSEAIEGVGDETKVISICEEEQPQNECESVENEDEDAEEDDDAQPVKKNRWLRNIIIAILLLAVAAVGYLFYKGYYLQPIDSFKVIEHENGDIAVLISSPIDESKLTVICSDTYGNLSYQPVKNGQAVFKDLAPGDAFTVEVKVDGFHKLTGNVSGSFTTPKRTTVSDFHAITGSEDGTVILTFSVDGPESNEWTIRYKSADTPEKFITFTDESCTISDLTVGQEYTFTLAPIANLNYTGTTEIKHTASNVIKAVDLQILSCIDGVMNVTWSAPADVTVEKWTVHCYNGNGYDKSIPVTETSVSFEGIDTSIKHTVEVKAENMSESEIAYLAANTITVADFKADTTEPDQISLNWNSATKENWLLTYRVDNSPTFEITEITDNQAVLKNIVPGSNYVFTLESKEGFTVLGGQVATKTPYADNFSGYGVEASNMKFKMCLTPSKKNWDKDDLKSKDYTTTFEIGDKASFLVKLSRKPKTSKDQITITYVIRNKDNEIISIATETATWKKMWDERYCELNIPAIPNTAGNYSISIFFNGALAKYQSFKIK